MTLKKFSVFVPVNEKGRAGEVLRVSHDRQLYREFLARLPAHSAIAVEARGIGLSLIQFPDLKPEPQSKQQHYNSYGQPG